MPGVLALNISKKSHNIYQKDNAHRLNKIENLH
jgi:hypothetical protein